MAVYITVSDDDLARFIAARGLGELHSFKGIAEGVENTNYLVDTDEGRFILTIYGERVDPRDLPFFLGLMEHLAAKGITCPLPVRDRNGQQVVELAGHPAALVTFLDGHSVRRPAPQHCEQVGEALARLHLAGLDYKVVRPNALGPKGWRPLYDKFGARADEIQQGLAATIATELAVLEPGWPRSLPSGVIHADLFPDNVFFLSGKLSGVIDFYFACNDWLAYDLAISINAWCFEPDLSFNVTRAQAMVRGYRRVRALGAAERDALALLLRGAALRFLLTRTHDWLNPRKDAIVKPHDPLDYLARLRFFQSFDAGLLYAGGSRAGPT